MVLPGETVTEIGGTVKGITALPGDDADHAGLGLAVFGGKAAGHHLHLLDRLHRHIGKGAAPVGAAQEQIAHARAVDEPLDLVLAAAADRIAGLALARRAEATGDRNGIKKDAGLDHQPLLGVAHRNTRELGDADVLDAGGDVLLDDRGLRINGHLLAEGDGLIHHLHPESSSEIDLDDHIFNDHTLAADHARPDRVGAGRHLEDKKLPVQAGSGPERGTHQDDICPGKRGAGVAIDGDASDFTGRAGLQHSGPRQQDDQQAACPFYFSQVHLQKARVIP